MLGRVTGAFGVKGWIRVYSYSRPVDGILNYPRWWISSSEASVGFEAQLLAGRRQGNALVAQITGRDGVTLENRDEAASLAGATIRVSRADLPPLPEGTYYLADLIGLKVQSISGVPLGQVDSLMDNGAQEVLIVVDNDRQRLIPFVQGPVVTKVCIEEGYLIVNWEPEY